MPRISRPLTDTQIKNAKPAESELILNDGGGLQLVVFPNGSRLWRFRYNRPTGKRTRIGLGSYPALTLGGARALRDEYLGLLVKGLDPQHRRAELKEARERTFLCVAQEWRVNHEGTVSAAYAAELWRSLERHVFPMLGAISIELLRAPDAIAALRPLAAENKLETLRRTCQRINEIMTFAVNSGYIAANPCEGIKQVFMRPSKQNMPTLAPERIPELLATVERAEMTTIIRNLLLWGLHTLARPGEAATTQWSEIDLEARVWRIPAAKMKMGRDHQVPLTDASLAILYAMQPISGHLPYVFPGVRNRQSHASKEAVNKALKRMGFKDELVAHGFRALGSTVLHAHGFDSTLIETSLSHIDGNAVRAAYNRSDFLERRRSMMNWWSELLTRAAPAAAA